MTLNLAGVRCAPHVQGLAAGTVDDERSCRDEFGVTRAVARASVPALVELARVRDAQAGDGEADLEAAVIAVDRGQARAGKARLGAELDRGSQRRGCLEERAAQERGSGHRGGGQGGTGGWSSGSATSGRPWPTGLAFGSFGWRRKRVRRTPRSRRSRP